MSAELNKYLGILRWSLQYQDGTSTNAKPMDEERRKWLMEAIEQQIEDPVEKMVNIIKVLKLEPQEKTTEDSDQTGEAFNESAFVKNRSEALDELIDYVENIDLARDFEKNGGVDVTLRLLDAKEEEIRLKSAEVLSLVVQNHPEMQEIVLKQKGLDILMAKWKSESCSDKEKVKLLLATSCLIRGSSEGTKAFIQTHKGVALLLETLEKVREDIGSETDQGGVSQSSKIRLLRKVLFLLRYLLNAVPAIRVVLSTLLVSTLSTLITHNDIDARESALKLIELIYEDSAAKERIEEGEWYPKFVNELKNYSTMMNLSSEDPAVKMCSKILKLIAGNKKVAAGVDDDQNDVFVKHVKSKPMKMTKKDGKVGLDLGTSGQ